MLNELIGAWKSGARVRRTTWLLFWGGRAAGYAEARAMDLPEEELVAAVRRGIWLHDYATARQQSSRLEVMQAQAATGDIFSYACERRAGHGHVAAIEAVRGPYGRDEKLPAVEVAAEPRTVVEPVRIRVFPPVAIEVRGGR
ncbi:hypothetical protein [Actinomadura violacea]|uniref:Uncharacterized protein n=1 Tax=Actinomadura violacea TaxID=2819934 RepID=A0ABS3RGX9_9ACTN|nr:hypothetical protein [Actinomadura violacea]MBO2455990.1 hypothetical protein [Actinomadura violacea]